MTVHVLLLLLGLTAVTTGPCTMGRCRSGCMAMCCCCLVSNEGGCVVRGCGCTHPFLNLHKALEALSACEV